MPKYLDFSSTKWREEGGKHRNVSFASGPRWRDANNFSACPLGLQAGTWCGFLQRVPAVEGPLLLLAQIGAVLQQPVGDPALADAWWGGKGGKEGRRKGRRSSVVLFYGGSE